MPPAWTPLTAATDDATDATVTVRGFDFGTSDEAIMLHMSSCGDVVSVVKSPCQGNAEVIYSTAAAAKLAAQTLNNTVISGNRRYIDVLPGPNRRPPPANAQSETVTVRGFDFNTTDEQIYNHMAAAGSIVNWQKNPGDRGSATITYSTVAEAQLALEQLQKSKISGNARYIDILPGSKPSAGLPRAGIVDSDFGASGPAGCHVLVRGFDFDTSDEAIQQHMSTAGSVVGVRKLEKPRGSAEVTFSSTDEAEIACRTLSNTTIPGNRRYIEVLPGKQVGGGGARPGPYSRAGGSSGSAGEDENPMMAMMPMMMQMMSSGGASGSGGGGNQMAGVMKMMKMMQMMNAMSSGYDS